MSRTYYDVDEVTDEIADRAVILFCLILGRKLVRFARWAPIVTNELIMRMDDLITEYRNPDPSTPPQTSFQAPRRYGDFPL